MTAAADRGGEDAVYIFYDSSDGVAGGWEYPTRAGTTTSYSFGDDATQLRDYGWYRENAGSTSHLVGEKKPNPWALTARHARSAYRAWMPRPDRV
jgi:hypothetical protein